MIAGAAVLPTAPLLLPGVSATLPEGVSKVCDAIDAVVEALPPADVAVLVAAGEPAIHFTGLATLEGIGLPDIAIDASVHDEVARELSDATGYPTVTGDALPLDLSVLTLHIGGVAPIVAVSVPPDAEFADLSAAGRAIVTTFGERDLRVVVVVTGDLSSGLTEKSPLHLVSGAIFYDEQAVAAVDGGRLDGLARLGPEEAQRVGSRAWAPLAVLHGVTAGAKVGMVVRHYSAPRGVGYLVASGG